MCIVDNPRPAVHLVHLLVHQLIKLAISHVILLVRRMNSFHFLTSTNLCQLNVPRVFLFFWFLAASICSFSVHLLFRWSICTCSPSVPTPLSTPCPTVTRQFRPAYRGEIVSHRGDRSGKRTGFDVFFHGNSGINHGKPGDFLVAGFFLLCVFSVSFFPNHQFMKQSLDCWNM